MQSNTAVKQEVRLLDYDARNPEINSRRSIDTGPGGMGGYYTEAFTRIKKYGPFIGYVCTFFAWHCAWYPQTVFYNGVDIYKYAELGTDILCLLCMCPLLTVYYWWRRWKKLERQGAFYVLHNHHYFRVQFYRASDKSLEIEDATRSERLSSELAWSRQYETDLRNGFRYLILASLLLGVFAVGLYYTPDFISSDPSFTPVLPYLNFLGGWKLLFWSLFFTRLIPRAIVPFAITAWEWDIQSRGYQYIPGARPFDPIIPVTTLETMRAEMAHGDMAMVAPLDAARQLGG